LTQLRTILAALALTGAAAAQGQAPGPVRLSESRIEDLINIEVTSVSKKQQKLTRAAAAVYVITSEDLRRSGATSIMEALRMVPGVQVARMGSNAWAISARGFNGRLSDKLLVMIDGRTVYSPLFSGVFWDAQDLRPEDIDRIEVIRGPGGAIWGANAVNGVINIIGKPASQTRGGLLSVSAGNENRPLAHVRYGARVRPDLALRFHASGTRRGSMASLEGGGAGDRWKTLRSGFRLDWAARPRDQITIEGDVAEGHIHDRIRYPLVTPPFARQVDQVTESESASVVGSWKRSFSDSSDIRLQVYWDHNRRDWALVRLHVDTVDADFRHRWAVSPRQEWIWGAGFRRVSTDLGNSELYRFNPARRATDLKTAFAQYELALAPERLWLTLGSRFESSFFSEFEAQPAAMLTWQIARNHSAWGSAARAVSTPSQYHRDLTALVDVIPDPSSLLGSIGGAPGMFGGGMPFDLSKIPLYLSIEATPDTASQAVIAYEAGYRALLFRSVNLDLAAFVNDYRSLLTLEPRSPAVSLAPPQPHIALAMQWGNNIYGRTRGLEAAIQWQPAARWRLHFSGSLLDQHLRLRPESRDFSFQRGAARNPKHQVHTRSYFDLTRTVEIDAAWYYTGKLGPGISRSDPGKIVPSYHRLDVRLGWRPRPWIEASLVGQNLTSARHLEFSSEDPSMFPAEIRRSAYVGILWRF
jgi:iron complex outermembrane receptor protein